MTTVTAGNTEPITLAPFETLTLVASNAVGTITLTSSAKKLVADQTLAIQNGTFGPYGCPMAASMVVRQGTVDYTKTDTAPVLSTDGGQASAPLVADLVNSRRVPGAVAVTLPTPYLSVGATMVHPSVVYVDAGWNGYQYWMASTPYPGTAGSPLGDSTYENPCILCSLDGVTWINPPGVTNPVIPWGGVVNSYYRDNHLLQDPTDTTRQIMIYLLRDTAATAKNYLYITTSRDGWKTFTPPVVIWFGSITTGAGLNKGDIAAPSIWYDSGLAKWVIQGHNADFAASGPFPVVRITSSSLFSGWDQTPVTVTFPVPYSTPAPGRGWWHSHFAYDPATGVVYGLVQDNPTNNGAPGNIYIAWSVNGGLNYLSKPIDMKGYWYRPTFAARKNRDGSKYLDCYFNTLLNTVTYRVTIRFDGYLYPLAASLKDLQMAVSGYNPGTAILFADSCIRADGALGTPTIGSAYGAASQGTWGITSNAIKAATVPAKQLIPTALNCRVSARFKTVWQASGDNGWFWFRTKDTSNGYRIGFSTQANYRLQKIVAGSIDTTFRSTANEPIGGLPTAGDVIEVRQNGARCEIYINDVFCEEFDDASWYSDSSGVNAQLQVSGSITAATFDAIVVKSL